MTISCHELGGLGAPLASDGYVTAYELPELRLPGVVGPLSYLEYGGHLGWPALALAARAVPGTAAGLDAIGSWPLRLVVDGDRPCGLVFTRAAGPFLQELTGSAELVGRDARYLFLRPDQTQGMGVPPPSPAQRMAMCRDLADAMRLLHDELAVPLPHVGAVGVLFRPEPEPTVLLVSREALLANGVTVPTMRLDELHWRPPGPEPSDDIAADRYRLGLFVLRCLTPDDECSTNRDPAAAEPVLDAVGMALLRAALDGRPDERPTADRWRRYLRRCLGQPQEAPRVVSVDLPGTVVAGEPVAVRWTADDADTVTLSAAGCGPTVVDARAGSGTIGLYLTRTSRLTVLARNEQGEHAVTTAPVAVATPGAHLDLPLQAPLPELPPPYAGPGVDVLVAAVPLTPSAMVPSMGDLADSRPWLRVPPPPRFDDTVLNCPVDVVSIMSGEAPR